MVDRTQQPAFGKIDRIDLQEPKVLHLSNGLPVFHIEAGTQDVVNVQLVFDTGTSHGNKVLVASTAMNTIKEGTSKHTAEEIIEATDLYGAHLNTSAVQDRSFLSLYTLSKHLDKLLPLMNEVYHDPIYPERELNTYILNRKQELLVKLEQVNHLCSRAFRASLFGKDHPYGRSANSEDYDRLNREDVIDFHRSFIKHRPTYIMVAGRPAPETYGMLEHTFGSDAREPMDDSIFQTSISTTNMVHVEKQGAVQNAIRIGRMLFNRTHPDFIGMQILCTVLGGFFGSRLMSNIREDKGYTYGVSASLTSLRHSGYLSISTQVGAEVCKAAIHEIYYEIERLHKELIPASELEPVRNYLLGSVMRSIDGPFHLANKWNSYLGHGLGIDEHHRMIQRIKTITPERLRDLARTYLQREDLIQVTAGRPLQ